MSEQPETSNNLASAESTTSSWRGQQVYLMAMACLILGVVVGYFLRGSQSPTQVATVAPPVQQAHGMPSSTEVQPPTLEKMKQMADKAAAPVLEKIKNNPKDFAALNDAGKVYRATHQFKEAAAYYEKALEIDPKNAATRTDLASCLYYTGDVDGALAQLDKALSYDPKFFGALLNVGIIKLQAKNDAAGAIGSWEKILKTDADPKQKSLVKKLIADTKRKSEKVTADEPKV
jgi:cytochrome c-type biogenesis protein CcmH/NrfG